MKNFLEKGETVTFIAERDMKSGEAYTLGDLTVILHGDVLKGREAVGYAEGVYTIPKKDDVSFKTCQSVTVKDGVVYPLEKGKERNGVVWDNADEKSLRVPVKINV